MHNSIYYNKGSDTENDLNHKHGFDFSNGADKSVRYMQSLLRLIARKEWVENLVEDHQRDKSVAVHFEVRLDHYREYFLDETPYDVSTVLSKYPAISYIGVRFLEDKPYVSFDFVI